MKVFYKLLLVLRGSFVITLVKVIWFISLVVQQAFPFNISSSSFKWKLQRQQMFLRVCVMRVHRIEYAANKELSICLSALLFPQHLSSNSAIFVLENPFYSSYCLLLKEDLSASTENQFLFISWYFSRFIWHQCAHFVPSKYGRDNYRFICVKKEKKRRKKHERIETNTLKLKHTRNEWFCHCIYGRNADNPII